MTDDSALLRQFPKFSTLELPASVSRAIQLVDSHDETNNDSLAKAIEQTPGLSDIVLTYMNSPLYAPPEPIASIQGAVVNLGYEIIRNFIAGYMTSYLFAGAKHERPAFSQKAYERHTLSTCIAADMLGCRVGFNNRFRLFTYGLIHDIGFVALEARYPEQIDAIHAKITEGVPMIVAEKAVMDGFTHGDIGAWLCRKWQLDEEAQRVVKYHHTPAVAPVQTTELLLLYLGNIIGTRIYQDGMAIHLGDSPVDERIMNRLGLTKKDMAEVDGAIDGELADFEKQYFFQS